MTRVNLTDRRIAALLPDATGQRRLELRDALVPGLIVRTAAKRKTFMLHSRFPGAKHPTRRAIGEVGTLSLDAARDVARQWLDLIRRGVDPAAEARRQVEEERKRLEADRLKQEGLFKAVVEDYIKRRVKGQRQGATAERVIRKELIAAWGDRPIGEITRRDVVKLVETIDDRGAPIMAATVFSHARTVFNWAINRGIYGLEHSPCDRVRVGDLTSRRKEPRQRVLSDDEILAFWKATARMPYPWKPLFRLLLLTGTRRNEAGEASWREFDLERNVWSVPPERFKSNATHLVPLTGDVLTLLEGLPRFQRGSHLFSMSFGERGVVHFHQAKVRLDALMLGYLRALARLRGEDPTQVALVPFVVHDLRRTLRTRLASLEVNDTVAEQVIGHGRKGLQRVYDQFKYEPQMRKALELWAAELRRIVSPPPVADNVVLLRQGA